MGRPQTIRAAAAASPRHVVLTTPSADSWTQVGGWRGLLVEPSACAVCELPHNREATIFHGAICGPGKTGLRGAARRNFRGALGMAAVS